MLGRVGVFGETEGILLLGLDLLLPAEPGNPLAEHTLALLDDGCVGNVDSELVLLVELLGVLTQVLADLLLLLLAEEGRGRGRQMNCLNFSVGFSERVFPEKVWRFQPFSI